MSWSGPNSVWDDVWLGLDLLPGVGKITGGIGRDLDTKKAKGQDGWTVEDNGYAPEDLILTLEFTSGQLRELQQILTRLAPSAGKARGPVTLTHQPSNLLGIRDVQLKKVGIPEVSGGIGRIQITLVQHYAGPKQTPAQAPKKGPGWHFPPQPSVNDQMDDILTG